VTPTRSSLRPSTHSEDEVVHFQRLRRRLARRSRGLQGINVAPMIDMTFLLLIFFVVTTTFEKREGVLSSRMPEESAVAAPLPIRPIVIRLSPAGVDSELSRILLEPSDQRPSNFRELHDLLIQLRQRPGFDAQTPVIVRAEAAVIWDHLVNAWNAAIRAGFQNIAFAES
jgi:biopolymer transport protein ExbD